MTLLAYLTSLPGRCTTCGAHLETQGCKCPGEEWTLFVRAIREVARPDGTVHQADVRPRIRGRVEPKHVGQFYRRARSLELIEDTGEREQSNDVAGRNADKLDRIYRLRSAA